MKEIRKQFLSFFKNKNYHILNSASIVPENDSTLLFVNSGMAPLKKYFINNDEYEFKNFANSQYCLRINGKHNDLSDIGYSKRHHTLFEMLGNFSFNANSKIDAIKNIWQFCISELNLDEGKLYVTVHESNLEKFF